MNDALAKRCKECGNVFAATKEYFGISKRHADGLDSHCRPCRRAKGKLWREQNPEKKSAASRRHYEKNTITVLSRNKQWREKNPDKVRSAKDNWRENNPDKVKKSSQRYYEKHVDKLRAQGKQYREANPDKERARRKRYRKSNPDKIRLIQRRWRQANPDKLCVFSQRRRTAKRALPATFTQQDWDSTLDHFNSCCAYCGNPPSLFDRHLVLHQEHFTPLSQGGGYTPDNIIPACQSCNFSKGDKKAEEWLIERFGARRGQVILKQIESYFSEVIG